MRRSHWLALCSATLLTACATHVSNQTPYTHYTLENGMEVLIWPNKNSESHDEVAMDLVIKAGSEDERPDQAGLAHFVEHLAFDQKDTLGGNPIDHWLDELSLDARVHSNAYTTYDHTDYYLRFQDASPKRLQTGIKLLAHYAQHTRFYDDEVEQEKPIIQGEWRYRINSSSANKQFHDSELEGHPWSQHAPIGNMDIVAQATPQQLEAFYQAHYRPDNALLVIAGDVNPDEVKDQIQQAFADWEKPTTAYQATSFPLHVPAADINIRTAGDMVGSRLEMEGFSEDWDIQSTTDLRRFELIDAVFYTLQQRLDRVEQTQRLNLSLQAYYGHHATSQRLGNFVLALEGDTQQFQKGAALLTQEWARMEQYGLTQTELDNWRNMTLEKERNSQDSARHLANYAVDRLMTGESMFSQQQYYTALRNMLPTFTVADTQAVAADILKFTPRITLVQNPAEQTLKAEQLIDWSQRPQNVAAPTAIATTKQDMWSIQQAPGSISTHSVLNNGIEVFTLSNGIQAYYSRLKSDSDKVNIKFVSNGGINCLDDQALRTAKIAIRAIKASGLRQMDGQALKAWLKERDLHLNPYLSYFSRGLSLEGANEQSDTLLRLAHVALTEAHVNAKMLDYYKQKQISALQQTATNNRDAFDRQVEAVIYKNTPSLQRMTEQEANALSEQDAKALYQDCFAGTQNYQLYIVGDLDSDVLQQQLARYIANIPVNPPHFKETHIEPTLDKSERITGSGIGGEASFITLMYERDKADLPWFNSSISEIEADELYEQLHEAIRERLGLTYSIQASFSGDSTLNDNVRLQIDLSVAPDQVESAIAAINDEINKRATTQITPSQINLQLEKQRKQYDKQTSGTERIMTLATASLFNRSMDTVLDADLSVPSYTGEQVNELYRKLISDKARHVEFVLNP